MSIGQLRLRFGKPLPVGPDLRLLRRQQRLERLDLVAIRGRVDLKHVFLTGRLFSTGPDHPSSHCETMGTTLHDDNVARRRREDVQHEKHYHDGDHGEDRDADLPGRGPGEQLQLDEDEPDENA